MNPVTMSNYNYNKIDINKRLSWKVNMFTLGPSTRVPMPISHCLDLNLVLREPETGWEPRSSSFFKAESR